jgi:drug/metabolite transporter (DMT)-like permease
MSWLSWVAFVTLCSVSYQTLVKQSAGKLPLFIFTATIGLTVFLASIAALVLSGSLKNITMPDKHVLALVAVTGLISFLLELGFFQMYNAGAPLTLARIITVSGAGVLLILVGVSVYGERLTLQQVAGIVLTLVGLYLMIAKRHA